MTDFVKRDVVESKSGCQYRVLCVVNGKVRCETLMLPKRVVDLKPASLKIVRASELRESHSTQPWIDEQIG